MDATGGEFFGLLVKKGTKVCFIEDGENIILQPITKDFYKKIRGSLKNSNLIGDLLEERRKERKKE